MEVEVLGNAMSLTSLLVLIALGCIVLLLLNDYWAHGYWKRRGVPFEPPLPIIANMRVFAKGVVEAFEVMQEKHGKVYGIYSFRTPVLVVGDPEMLRSITVKNFNSFHSRVDIPQAAGELRSMLSVMEGQRWKEVRNIVTPTFSAAKMKQMSNLINTNADTLVKYIGLKQEEKGRIECSEVFGSFVMDTIGSCAFGLNIDSQSNAGNPFVTNAKRAFKFDFQKPLFILGSLIPSLGRLMANFRISMLIPAEVLDFFNDVTKKTINLRKEAVAGSNFKRVDFLQLLLDAQKQETVDKAVDHVEEDDENDIHDDLDKHHDVHYHTKTLGKRAPLTDEEVFAQVLIFFTAGAETTTTLLGFIFYALSMNPDIQEKLINEVDEVTPSRDSVGYSSIATMPYLDQVVCETLRLYPPAGISNRMCNETFVHNGLMIEKGTQVFIPVYTIHRDPDYWPEPEKFDPDRFTKEAKAKQHPFAWQPFGAGPRNCIGMRFALMETKMAVVRTLQNYRFETCAETEIPPKFGRSGFLTPTNGVTLRAVPRTDKVA
ncbi:cytochrome P450 3A9 [Strongylocentrotus purpuratus]|uniref:Thromboxane-A synthase n=1 Tax=Strongylocentrotus purpuratus TaxID=7668 RepID=A0A7M7NB43_STRPU|nr:cytochrome P450 3A9 [Strongylocentrotus purpuratus]